MTTPPAPVTPDLRSLLTDEDLATLRSAYRAADMIEKAHGASVDTFPPAGAFANFLLDYFYEAGSGSTPASAEPWTPAERELVLLGLLSSRLMGRGLNLALHVYWGLMVGLSVQRIADTLTLAGIYSGMQSFTGSLGVLKGTLLVLHGTASIDPSTNAIVGLLITRFA